MHLDEFPIFTHAAELQSSTVQPRLLQPGQQVHISWWIENTGEVPLFLTGAFARFLAHHPRRREDTPDDD
jgi:hypothetical protein